MAAAGAGLIVLALAVQPDRATPPIRPERDLLRAQALPPDWHWWQYPQPLAGLYGEVQRQATMLAFCDDYWFFTLVFLALLPLVFLMRRAPKTAAGPGMGH